MVLPSIKILVPILRKNLLTHLIVMTLISPTLFSQDITGNLEGRVSDSTGVALSNINVSIFSSSLQGSRGITTNDYGFFRFLSLPVGKYRLKISAVGYSNLNIEDVQVLLGKTTYVGEILIQQQAISLPEISVSGKRPIIDPVSTTYGGNISFSVFEDLPVDRNYVDIATLLPPFCF